MATAMLAFPQGCGSNESQLVSVDVADGDDETFVDEDLFDGDVVDDSGLVDIQEEVYGADDGTQQSADTNKFDMIVGVLEDIMLDAEFEMEREEFCRTNCKHFEASPENKLIYTELFEQYTQLIEGVIEAKLQEAVQDFSMQEFLEMLDARKDELDADVFDFILSMADFEAFQELMLAYKVEVVDGASFEISCAHMLVHTEEQEDGEQRPDLDFGLSVSQLSPKGK